MVVVEIYDEQQAIEVPRAYIVLRKRVKGDKGDEDVIVEWSRKKMAGHKRLRDGVLFVHEIPKSASGKNLRRELKAKAVEKGKRKGGKAKL